MKTLTMMDIEKLGLTVIDDKATYKGVYIADVLTDEELHLLNRFMYGLSCRSSLERQALLLATDKYSRLASLSDISAIQHKLCVISPSDSLRDCTNTPVVFIQDMDSRVSRKTFYTQEVFTLKATKVYKKAGRPAHINNKGAYNV